MKQLIFLFLFFIGTTTFAQTITTDALRRSYQQVSTDSVTCAKLYKKISSSTDSDNIQIAYRGAITASMANHSKDKKEKLNLFNTGKKLLEQSIASDSANIETRFLRFTIQCNAPKALNYNKQLKADKDFILKQYANVSNLAVKRMISSFAQQCSALSETEKQKLK